ncbi:MAG: hypothetical protein K2X44_06650, partial [Magnetospirillum sp.]|nr:hypothetical protein [Magnetospirillum sp.]
MSHIPFLDTAAPHAPALLDDHSHAWISYGVLKQRAEEWANRLGPGGGLSFLVMENSVEAVAALLGAWSAGRTAALLSPG